MICKIRRKHVAALLGIPASLAITRAIWAQTSTWTGSGPDNLWTDTANWDTSLVPISGSTAAFTSISSGFTSISLGSANQPIGSITFTGSAPSYNLGVNAGDTFTFDSGGSIIANSSVTNAQVISAAINTTGNLTISNSISNGATSGAGLTGLTVNAIKITGSGLLTVSDNGANETTSLNGPITDVAGQPGSVAILANTGPVNNTIIINGFNTYSGTTALMVTAQGTIQFSTDSPFGTGKITVFNTGQMQAIGGSHTISNAIDFNSGLNFTGTNTITVAGTLAIINATVNGSRTFASNGTMTVNWGNPNSPSVFNLGNPVSNGGDGAGKFAAFTYSQPGTYIINDVMQNPSASGSGGVTCTFTTGGTYAVNSLNTYTGATTFGGTGSGAIATFNHSYVAGGTSGPFGLGTIVFSNSSSNGVSLQPTGGNQTLANPITLTQGFSVNNATADNSGLTLAGNITMSTSSRSITNNFASAVLTLGAATSPATLTLGNNLQINGGTTVINDLIQNNGANAGGILVTSGLTQLTNPSNTYTKGTTINGGVLSVSADGNLGSTTANINVGSGTLLSTGSFTSARSINLTGTVAGTVDVTSGNTLTLTGPITGTSDLTKGTNSGTLQLAQSTGYTLSGNVNVNGGLLDFGATSTFTNTPNGPVVNGGGLSGPVSVGGALTINAGTKAAMNPSLPGTGQTNSIGSLSIGNGGALDIGNHTVIVQNAPDETVIGKYLSHGYSGGFWNGTSPSGGAIQSIVAFNDNSGATSVGYGNSNDFTFGGSTSPYRAGGPKALSGNQVVVAPALEGDLLLEGSVGPDDLAFVLNAFGTTGNDWAFGNIDYDAAGLVGPNDLSLLLSNFGHSSAGFAGAKTSAKSLTSTAKPSLVASSSDVAPPPADGIELIVNTSNGDVELEGNLATLATSVVLTSPGSTLIGGTTFTPAFHALFDTTASNTSGLIDEFNTFANGSTVDGIIDMGNVYNAVQNSEDVQFQFSEKGINRGGLQTGSVFYVTGVPEPTTMSLLAVASAGLLSRRRKRRYS